MEACLQGVVGGSLWFCMCDVWVFVLGVLTRCRVFWCLLLALKAVAVSPLRAVVWLRTAR